ncbi:hypothetical protein [Aquipuribacter sp. SD81]|uniref:hypothetical protein n=1 Tax=Aquipuribacter sp. SD81 TaxID=3127703 RepID=UPI003016151C
MAPGRGPAAGPDVRRGRPGRPGRLALACVALGVVVALLTAPGALARATYGAQVTADEPQYLLSALSLVTDGDLDVSDELAEQRWRAWHAADLPEQTRPRPDGSRLSPHDPLLPLLLAPAVAAGPGLGLPGWLLAKLALAGLAGVTAAVTAWVSVRRLRVPAVPALVTVAAFALSPPIAVYATQVYPELPAALAVVLALGCLLGRPGRGAAVALGLAVVALPWLAVKYALVALVLAVAGLVWLRRDRPAQVTWALGLGLAGAHWLWFHLVVYGGLTSYASGDYFEGGSVSATGPDPDYAARSQRLVGLLVDRDFGLLAWAPVVVLLPVAIGWALVHRRRGGAPAGPPAAAPTVLLAVLAAGWVVATWVAQTMHGWWWPGRQLVVVLPAAVLLVAAWAGAAWGAGRAGAGRTALVAVLGLAGAGAWAALVAATASTTALDGRDDPVAREAGRHTLVVDLARTSWPVYRALRAVLPDLTTPGPATAALTVAWTVVLVGLVVLGGRGAARVRRGARPPVRTSP